MNRVSSRWALFNFRIEKTNIALTQLLFLSLYQFLFKMPKDSNSIIFKTWNTLSSDKCSYFGPSGKLFAVTSGKLLLTYLNLLISYNYLVN